MSPVTPEWSPQHCPLPPHLWDLESFLSKVWIIILYVYHTICTPVYTLLRRRDLEPLWIPRSLSAGQWMHSFMEEDSLNLRGGWGTDKVWGKQDRHSSSWYTQCTFPVWRGECSKLLNYVKITSFACILNGIKYKLDVPLEGLLLKVTFSSIFFLSEANQKRSEQLYRARL
jgi:hypothetical protein